MARHPVPDPPVGHEIQSACQLALAPGCCLQDWSLWLSFELAHKSCRNGGVARMDHGQADRPCLTHPVVVGQFACKRKSTTRILRDVPGVEERNFEEVPSCRGSSQWTTRCVDNRSGFGEEDDSNTGGVGERELVLVFSVL